ncbi:MAG: acetylxylan esterase, partial [Lentisphaeria bacterium]|nr:acetylxylan esterase [Lentisphaeria bacterium]
KDIPWEVKQHVLHGIGSKETYILRGAVSDLWTAASVLVDMFPDTAENLCYSGASMGGGMGALMLPWDKRFRAAILQVPTFGGNPYRLKVPSAGSGEAVRLYVQEHPEAMKVLAWFDAAISAKHLSIPTVVLPALEDNVVAPEGQFCVANSIPSEYKYQYILDKGHAAGTDRDKAVMEEAYEKRDELFHVIPS